MSLQTQINIHIMITNLGITTKSNNNDTLGKQLLKDIYMNEMMSVLLSYLEFFIQHQFFFIFLLHRLSCFLSITNTNKPIRENIL